MSVSSSTSKRFILKPRESSAPCSSQQTTSSSSSLVKASLENQQVGQSASPRSLAKRMTITPDVDSLSEHFGRLEIPSGHGKKQRTRKSASDLGNFSGIESFDLLTSSSYPQINKERNSKTDRRPGTLPISSSLACSSTPVEPISSVGIGKKQRTLKFETEPTAVIPLSEEAACSTPPEEPVSSIGIGKKQRTLKSATEPTAVIPLSEEAACSTPPEEPVSSIGIGKKQRTLKFETEPTAVIPLSEEAACSTPPEEPVSSIGIGKKQRTLKSKIEPTASLPLFDEVTTSSSSSSSSSITATNSTVTALTPADLFAREARRKMLERHYSAATADFQTAFQTYLSEKDLHFPDPTTNFSTCNLSDYVPPHVLKDAGFTYFKLNAFEASSRFYVQTVRAYKKRQECCPPKVFGMAGLSQLEAGQIENAYEYFEMAGKQPLLVPGWIWARAAHRFLEMSRYAEVSGFSARAKNSYEFQKKKLPLEYWEVAITGAIKLGLHSTVIELVERGLFAFRCAGKKPPQSFFIAGIHAYLCIEDIQKAFELSNLSVQHL
jgi:hypothetical protein